MAEADAMIQQRTRRKMYDSRALLGLQILTRLDPLNVQGAPRSPFVRELKHAREPAGMLSIQKMAVRPFWASLP